MHTSNTLENLLTRCRKGYNDIESMQFLQFYVEAGVHTCIFKTSYIPDSERFILQQFHCLSFIQLIPVSSTFTDKRENNIFAACDGSKYYLAIHASRAVAILPWKGDISRLSGRIHV